MTSPRQRARFEEASRVMPWGTQTNAKRPDPALLDVLPLFVDRAEGCRFRDVDGRWFIDFRAALGPILLGYRYPPVEDAVRRQLDRGVLFSMASPLELDVARLLVDRLPGVEQVRFMKTGNDANSAAVRLARAYTGRDHLVTCGYHGYGDWFATTLPGGAPAVRTPNGVPEALDALVTTIPYGSIAALENAFERHGECIAALLTVPYDWEGDPEAGRAFLKRARALADAHGSLLIFDQILTGFRLARAGAQEYFGVVPDLTTYAKGLANGYPLSAFAGRHAVMGMLDRVRITTTYAGEALSLAAAWATLEVLWHEPVLSHLIDLGRRLMDGFDAAARENDLSARAVGAPVAPQLRFGDNPDTDAAARRIFDRALLEHGVFPSRPFFLMYAHQLEDLEHTLDAVRVALERVAEARLDADRSERSSW